MMTSSNEVELLQTVLDRQGLVVLEADIPFLLRTFQRQRQLVDSWNVLVHPQTEPAHTFAASRPPSILQKVADPTRTESGPT